MIDQSRIALPPSPSRAAPTTTSALEAVDPEIAGLIRAEADRQRDKLILIASESRCPESVLEALASPFTNLYAEGYPSSRMAVFERQMLDWTARHLAFYRRYGDRRYYKGCDYVNFVEALAIRRISQLFARGDLDPNDIFVNVQALSGAAANNAVYEAFLQPGDTVMGMHLSYGGHLTHGSPVNRSGKRYRVISYTADPKTGQFDWDRLEEMARNEAPRLVIAGYSAFPWSIDWRRFRKVADASPQRAILLADIAHPSGLVVAGQFPNPVGIADVVSFTTHKTFCGPRAAVLLSTRPEIARALDLAVFPGEQGGPHINTIAALAVAAKLASTSEFRELQQRVVENCQALADGFRKRGLTLAYGGTDTHLCLIDLKSVKAADGTTLSADVAARILDLVGITCNKNAIAFDTSAAHPSGLRFGTMWVTQRGLRTNHMDRLAEIVTRVITCVRSFRVRTGSGQRGRGRIEAAVLEEARAGVAQLIEECTDGPSSGSLGYPHYQSPRAARLARSSPLEPLWRRLGARTRQQRGRSVVVDFGKPEAELAAARRAAVLCDITDKGLMGISGERAMSFLQSVLSADVASIRTGLSTRSLVLDDRGCVLDDVLLHHLPDDGRGFPRYWISVHADRRELLLTYLRGLSDGFVEIDREGDPYRKVEGPVVIEDLGETEERKEQRVTLGMAGPKALEVLMAVTTLRDITQFQFVDATVAGAPATISIGSLDRDQATIELYLHPDVAERVFQEILRAGQPLGLLPAGLYVRDALRKAAGLPAGGEERPLLVSDLSPATRRLHVSPTKPWFIGCRSSEAPLGDEKPAFAWTEPVGLPLRRTPLFDEHARLTKKWDLVPFAGWEMPVLYSSIVEEHRVVRQAAGLFDVAHMGVFDVTGEGAERFLDLVTTNCVMRLRPGQGHYSYVLGVDGEVLDDILVYRMEKERFLVVVNAVNAEKIWAWWNAVLRHEVIIDRDRRGIAIDVSPRLRDLKDPSSGPDQRIDLALQGAASRAILVELADGEQLRQRITRLGRFELTAGRIAGIDLYVARTGYTGEEIGYELYVHPENAVTLWNVLLEKGEARGVRPTGLGARDSTRTEAGFPLWGHELAGPFDITPKAAGYAGFVKYHKPFFIGRDRLLRRDSELDHEIVRFEVTSPRARPIRSGDPVADARGRYMGRVTSCTVVAGGQVGLAYVKRGSLREGARIAVFTLPREGGKLSERPKAELAEGDSVLLHLDGVILPRFMSPGEKQRRKY
ncbi:MAG: serine hydroxymethyltransferase [Planctomycetota bacterium]